MAVSSLPDNHKKFDEKSNFKSNILFSMYKKKYSFPLKVNRLFLMAIVYFYYRIMLSFFFIVNNSRPLMEQSM